MKKEVHVKVKIDGQSYDICLFYLNTTVIIEIRTFYQNYFFILSQCVKMNYYYHGEDEYKLKEYNI